MATPRFQNFSNGIGLIPNASTLVASKGDMEVLDASGKLNYHDGTSASPMVTEAHTATLTNKTLTSPKINENVVMSSTSTQLNYLSAATGTTGNTATNVVFSTSPTLVTPDIGVATATSVNKLVITAPTTAATFIFGVDNATLTFQGTGTVVNTDSTDTLTNKTISGLNNTISDIPDSALSANVMLLNGIQTVTGAKTFNDSKLILAGATSGTTTLNASAVASGILTLPAVTDTIVARTTTDTLTNKTLTSPVINTATADTITAIAGGDLTLTGASNFNINLTATGTGIVNIGPLTFTPGTNQISTSSTDITIYSGSGVGQILNLDAVSSGKISLKNNGSEVAKVDTNGLTMAAAKPIILTRNSQTVTLEAHASASATYSVTFPAAAPTASTALVYDGSNYVWSTAGGWAVNSSTSLAASGTISISTTAGQQIWRVASSGGAVTLSNTPFGTSAPVDGAAIRLVGTSDTNTVQISNNDAAKGCLVNGNVTLVKGAIIEFQYIATDDRYYEVSRNF